MFARDDLCIILHTSRSKTLSSCSPTPGPPGFSRAKRFHRRYNDKRHCSTGSITAIGTFLFSFFLHFYFPASGQQAVVTGIVPSSPRFLPSIFIAHRVQQSHCSSIFHRVLLTHARLLSASHIVYKKRHYSASTALARCTSQKRVCHVKNWAKKSSFEPLEMARSLVRFSPWPALFSVFQDFFLLYENCVRLYQEHMFLLGPKCSSRVGIVAII